MKLHNCTKDIAFLRDTKKRNIITLLPGAMIDIEPYHLAEYKRCLQAAGLNVLFDEKDLPKEIQGNAEDYVGTFKYFQAHNNANKEEGDNSLNSPELSEQSLGQSSDDAKEVSNIWKDQIAKENVSTELSSPPSSFFLFPKKNDDEITVTKTVHEISHITNEDLQGMFGADGADGEETLDDNDHEGPAYLRNNPSPSRELEGFGGGGGDNDVLDGGFGRLPESSPVTFSQLNLSTKAELWEMADKLGIESGGTKKEIITRLCEKYWLDHNLAVNVKRIQRKT